MKALIYVLMSVLLLVGAALAALPVADDTPITASGLHVIPAGATSVDFDADGDVTVSFRENSGAKVRKIELRADKPRSFNFAPGDWDSIYYTMTSAGECIPTWTAN